MGNGEAQLISALMICPETAASKAWPTMDRPEAEVAKPPDCRTVPTWLEATDIFSALPGVALLSR